MIRLIVLVVLFLISLLTVVRPPAYFLWMATVVVDGFPWVFAGVAALVVAAGIRTGKYRLAGTLTGIVAVLLFMSPVLQAWRVAVQVDRRFNAAWGLPVNSGGDIRPRPFVFQRMFSGVRKVPYRSFTYRRYPGISLTLDFYPSSLKGVRPCIIVVHGGSWSSGDSRELPEINSVLAGAGYQVASINYRLAPGYQSPLQVNDVQCAFNYLKAHRVELGIDTSRFVLLGRSAGGQIALQAAYTLAEPGLRGVVGFYAPADMVWGYSVPANPWIMDSRKVMRDYLGGSYEQFPRHYENSSPLLAASPRSVPTLLIHGKKDVLVAYEHSIRLSKKLAGDNVKCFLLTLPWATHGFDYNIRGPGGQIATYTVKRFLRQVTR
ncbi:alpha/beta hydrolase [Compostibacter hankyongensis]|uniref:BD-FAE-like domain-containing protein n=1 Tax=Compostibacter hankyongensis TaxID=1007089 RepID=A0ABP8G5A1_9BACT